MLRLNLLCKSLLIDDEEEIKTNEIFTQQRYDRRFSMSFDAHVIRMKCKKITTTTKN